MCVIYPSLLLFLLYRPPFTWVFCFLLHVTCILLFLSRATQLSPYTFLVEAFTPCFVLTYEDLELGTADKEGSEAFVFLRLGYLTQYNLF